MSFFLSLFFTNRHILYIEYPFGHVYDRTSYNKGEYNKTSLSPQVKLLLLIVPRRCFFCGSFFVIYVACQSCCHVCSLQPCGHLLGKG